MNMLVSNKKNIVSILTIIMCVGWTTTSYSQAVLSVEPAELAETDLNGQKVTLKLTDQTWIESEESIENALSVSGIEGVTFLKRYKNTNRRFVPYNPFCVGWCEGYYVTNSYWVEQVDRVDDTTVTIELKFEGDFETDSILTFTVEAAAIENYDGPVLTAEIPVNPYKGVFASATPPLTETTLDESMITLTLSWGTGAYEVDVATIINAVTVTGIDGVTIETATAQRISDREITVELNFDGTDFDTDIALIFSMGAGAITDYAGDVFTTEIPVTAVKEFISASVVSPLTETNLDDGSVTLTLAGATYEQDISKIRDVVNVSGINGVRLDTDTMQRISDTEITVELDYDDTDFDTDTALIFSIATGAIANYIGEELTTEILVTAIRESISASAVSPLTETRLDGSTIALTLTAVSYQQDISTISEGLTVSGVSGVTLDTDTVERISDTKITVELNYDGTDFDTHTELTFNIDETALTGKVEKAELTAKIPVTAVKEFVSAAVVSPLTEATLDGGIVTLIFRGEIYEQDISKIRDAVTISGINGVTIDTASVQRISDTEITVELDYDGTDFVQDRALTFSVGAGAIADYTQDAFTAEIPVTANRGEAHLIIFWTDFGTDKIQRANLNGSDVQDLVTQGLNSPSGIALDVAGGKMYWTNWRTDKIQRANLDGSDVQDLVTQGLAGPRGIALDVAGGKMYWTDSTNNRYGTDKIQRANLDGSDVQDLVTQEWTSPSSIALDVAGGKMYWTDFGRGKIQRADLDGSDVQDLVTQGLSGPRGIALDVAGGKMYWADRDTDKIQRANLDGSDVQDLVTQGLDIPHSIALDVAGGKMYWTDSGTNKIQRANLDGSNVENLGIPGLSLIGGIALGIIFPINSTTAKEDVNRDGVVDLNDLVIISLRYGQTGSNPADVNGDKVVNVDDLILVAAVIDNAAAAAPAARAQVLSHFTKSQLQGWLTEARASGNTSRTYQRGIAVLEQLLALFAPEKTVLLANYPNPFNPETWIPYQLSKPADVTLMIYDIKGHVVRALDLGHQRAGLYQTRNRAAYWDGRNAVGEKVATGIYFYTLTAGDFVATRKMLILK